MKQSLREAKYKNYQENGLKEINGVENPANKEMREAIQTAMKNYDNDQKYIFIAMNKYFLKQDAGITLPPPADAKKLAGAYERVLSNHGNEVLTKTMSDAQYFTERQTHKDFSYNRVYSLADDRAASETRLPNQKESVNTLAKTLV